MTVKLEKSDLASLEKAQREYKESKGRKPLLTVSRVQEVGGSFLLVFGRSDRLAEAVDSVVIEASVAAAVQKLLDGLK